MTLFSCPAEAAEAIAYVKAVGLIVVAVGFSLGLLIGLSAGKGKTLQWGDPDEES